VPLFKEIATMVSKHSPATPDSIPADPAADLLSRLREQLAAALQLAHDVDHLVETTRQRGALRADERARLQCWRADAAASYGLVSALQRVEDYLVRQRHDPMAS
jgi:hypothetical protein